MFDIQKVWQREYSKSFFAEHYDKIIKYIDAISGDNDEKTDTKISRTFPVTSQDKKIAILK